MEPVLGTLVCKFKDIWGAPSAERLGELMHPDIVMLQPVLAPIRGRLAGVAEFTKPLAWLPDIKGTVDHSSGSGRTLMIAWRLGFTLGRAPYELRLVDRIIMEDGLIREREAYYDSIGFMRAVLSRPSAWGGYLRYQGYS